jgi:hypothetical protein
MKVDIELVLLGLIENDARPPRRHTRQAGCEVNWKNSSASWS